MSRRHIQGHLVFQCNPDESQRLERLGGPPPARRRHVRIACVPEQTHRRVASRCHDWGHVATAHLRAVFITRDLADPRRLVCNRPLPADPGEQALGRGPRGAQAGDSIDHFSPFLACLREPHMPSQLKDLRQPGPIAVADEGRTRRALALLAAPMAQGDRLRRGWAVANGRARQDQRDIGPQLRLVLFDEHDLIPALVDNRLREVAWGQERVHRDHPTVQDQVR
jgi:hypothetical protein